MDTYLRLVVEERAWSWTLVAIGYMGVALAIRQVFFHALIQEAKQIDSSFYGAVRKAYQKRSLAGWIIFLLSLSLLISAWVGWKLPGFEFDLLIFVLVGTPLLLLLSICLHLQAVSRALVSVLRQKMGSLREF